MFTFQEKLDELRRELKNRELLYPAHLRAELISGFDAERRIDLIKEIIADYARFTNQPQPARGRHNDCDARFSA
jgi:hypothetical protein